MNSYVLLGSKRWTAAGCVHAFQLLDMGVKVTGHCSVSLRASLRFNLAVKEEPEDGDFVPEKRGKKRKRPEDEPMEGPSCSSATPT